MRSGVMKRFAFLLSIMLVSCVTINIYFPAAAVEKAADRIVDEVWGEKLKKKMEEKKEEEKKGQESPQGLLEEFYRRHIAGLIMGVAHAEEADINVTTPAIRALKASIKQRAGRLIPFLDRGNVGLTNDGLLKIRNTKGLALKERALLKRLVKAENADRNALYLEIARANNISADKVEDIRRIFAKSWAKKARPGWWIQGPDGRWYRKK